MTDERQPPAKGRGFTGTKTRKPVRNRRIERDEGGPLVADGGFHVTELTRALADERRRYVLYYLRDEESAELDDVTERVATWESETPPDDLDERTKKRVRIDLYHAQLPKLEEAGMIEYDRRHGSVRLRPLPDHVEAFLDSCAAIEAFEIPE